MNSCYNSLFPFCIPFIHLFIYLFIHSSIHLSSNYPSATVFNHRSSWTITTCIFSLHHRPNPIIELFTGQCMTEGFLNGEPFVNHSQFGAFPVQVEGHTHLHDSLEAATVNNEMQQEVRLSFMHIYNKKRPFFHKFFI